MAEAAAAVAVASVFEIAKQVNGVIGGDSDKRNRFAKELVEKMYNESGRNCTVIAVCVAHDIKGDYHKTHAECYYFLGTSQGYEVYVIANGRNATFERRGDGGPINWAFAGDSNYFCYDGDKKLTMGDFRPAPPPDMRREYIVQPNDFLYSIAQRLGTSVEHLVTQNGIKDPTMIHPGQKLIY
jgi:hypothetical protein